MVSTDIGQWCRMMVLCTNIGYYIDIMMSDDGVLAEHNNDVCDGVL